MLCAGVALSCMSGALVEEWSKSRTMRCCYGVLQFMTAAASTQTTSRHQAGFPQAMADDSIQRIIVQYATGLHRLGSTGAQRNAESIAASPAAALAEAETDRQYPSEAYLALLAAAVPSLLPRVLAELAAHAEADPQQMDEKERQQRVLEATRVLIEVLGDGRLKCSLLGLQAEAGQVVIKLTTALSPLHASESSRLDNLFTTFYGLPVTYVSQK